MGVLITFDLFLEYLFRYNECQREEWFSIRTVEMTTISEERRDKGHEL